MHINTTILKTIYFTPIVIAILIAVLCETELVPCGLGIDADSSNAEVITLGIMEMLTLCIIPLALRMMKFHAIAQKAKSSWHSYSRIASVRILAMALPMLVNTLFYYYYLVPAFGYLAIILLLAMVFVYPSKSRCKNETE